MKDMNYSENFRRWLRIKMEENGIKTYEELSQKIGVSRQAIYSWISHPEKIKRINLAGLIYLLEDKNEFINNLCYRFGIQ